MPVADPERIIPDVAMTSPSENTDADLKMRIENTLIRDQHLLETFSQPITVLKQMNECGIRTLTPSNAADATGCSDPSITDNFFDSVDWNM